MKNLSQVPKTPRQASSGSTIEAREPHTDGHAQAWERQPRLLLVCSPGGHLQQMLSLESAWSGCERTWATLAAADVAHALAGEEVVIAHGPTNRSILNLVRNLPLAWRLIRRRNPDVILSTGAGLAVPFFLIGRLLGRRLVYVESLTRTETVSLSGRIVYPLTHDFFVQWPQAASRRRMRYVGSLL